MQLMVPDTFGEEQEIESTITAMRRSWAEATHAKWMCRVTGRLATNTPFLRLPSNPVLFLDYCTVTELKPTDVNSLKDT
jgi:hypothetical protein